MISTDALQVGLFSSLTKGRRWGSLTKGRRKRSLMERRVLSIVYKNDRFKNDRLKTTI